MSQSRHRQWYTLFSRGAKDWLRHNDKMREAVQQHLPDLIAGPDLMTGPQDRTIQVPVRMLEHARFRLADGRGQTGAGQGPGVPGDALAPAPAGAPGEAAAAGHGQGEVQLMVEFPIEDVLDWVWEAFRLPDLHPSPTASMDDVELVREGWDRHGVRSRLDRRRTVKEAIKRRAMQSEAKAEPVPFTNDDLRFRQVAARQRPTTSATILFLIDVSASMTQPERSLAKSFFFFALQGIRRTYARVRTRFIAHTTHAWEFSESDFFQVSGLGGTIASSAFRLALDLIRHDPQLAGDNLYLFYASDGENFAEDRGAAGAALAELAGMMNLIGYVETVPAAPRGLETEMRRVFHELERQGKPVASHPLSNTEDVWRALRRFFTQARADLPAELTP